MLLSLFSCVSFSAAGAYDTVDLNGFTIWTQAELDKSSGNNGYANGCITKLTVVTDAQYIVGNGSQAIKAVKGGSQSYNNCIVNWTYGTGGWYSNSATYAVRIINIPANNADATIYARPHFICEDAEGEQIVVYDDICSATYAE